MEPILKHLKDAVGNILAPIRDPFSEDIAGLPEATGTATAEVAHGEVFELRAAPVRKRIGDDTVKMLAYNGSVPGPTLRVAQGSEVVINFTNETEVETTVHWHGLRLDNRFDGVAEGVHHGMQPPIPTGGSFTYRLRFPDPGLYWYHPHIREDYAQEHGLYGNIIVVPNDATYWPPVNRELTLVLDDILIERGKIAPFSQSQPNRTAMGRFGNVMLTNGETAHSLSANQGEVVRLYITNTANVRVFNLHIPGARQMLVGVDNGRIEREELVEAVLVAPSERAIVDVLFEQAGQLTLEHRTPDKTYPLGTVDVREQPVDRSFAQEFAILRWSAALDAERFSIVADFDRPPDKTLALVGDMGHGGHHMGHEAGDIEWEDTMQLMNRMATPRNMHWKLIDRETGAENHAIHWSFTQGDRVKIRIVNEPDSDHPMQHPIHVHGQRFLVLSRNGVPNFNLQWKDTVLCHTGETVDILVDMTNPGAWMVHCHVAEHMESHMMLTYVVHQLHEDAPSATPTSHGEHMHHGPHTMPMDGS